MGNSLTEMGRGKERFNIKIIKSLLLSVILLVVMAQLCSASPLGIGARALGMGGAYTAIADDGVAAYWNPAGISQVNMGLALNAGLQGDFAALEAINEQDPDALDGAFALKGGAGLIFGHFGLNAFTDRQAEVLSGGVPKTLWFNQNDQVALTLATELTDLLAFGVNAKYVMVHTESFTDAGSMGKADGNGFAVDLGAMLKVGKLVRMGAVLKDYALAEIKLDGDNYELPTKLVLGGAVKVPLFGMVVAADLETPLKGEKEPTLHFGVEQPLLGILFLRAGGYKGAEEFNFTAGCGLKLGPVAVDLATDLGAEKPAVYATAGLKF